MKAITLKNLPKSTTNKTGGAPNITQGEWESERIGFHEITIHTDKMDICTVLGMDIDEDEFESNAQLIAEAGTVTNECKLTPRQLLQQRDKMLEALKKLVFTASKLWDDAKPIKDSQALTVTHPIIEEAKAAIALTEPK